MKQPPKDWLKQECIKQYAAHLYMAGQCREAGSKTAEAVYERAAESVRRYMVRNGLLKHDERIVA